MTQPAATLRRPLILDEAGQAAWLDPATLLETLQQLLLQPSPALRERPLATLVNDPRLDSPNASPRLEAGPSERLRQTLN